MPIGQPNVLLTAQQVPRFILRLPSGNFFAEKSPAGRILETPRMRDAKVFYSMRSAQTAQAMLGGDIMPAPDSASDSPPQTVEPYLGRDYLKAVAERTATENLAACMVEASGNSVFAGLQKGFWHDGKLQPTLVLWNSILTGTTLAAPISEVSSDSIRAITAESDRVFYSSDGGVI